MTTPNIRQRRSRGVRLESLSLENFKSVRSATIPLGQMTLLVGENSSGKSSVLQALQLVRQAAVEGTTGEDFPLNGNVIRVGEISDLRTAGTRYSDAVSIGISLRMPRERWHGRWTIQSGELGIELDDERSMADNLTVDWSIDLVGTAVDEPGSSMIRRLRLAVKNANDSELANVSLTHKVRSTPGSDPGSKDPLAMGDRLRRITARGLHRSRIDMAFSGTIRSLQARGTRVVGASVTGGFPTSFVVNRKLSEAFASAWVRESIDPNPWQRYSIDRDPRQHVPTISTEDEFVEHSVRELRWLLDVPQDEVPEVAVVPKITKSLRDSLLKPGAEARTVKAIANQIDDDSKIPVHLEDSRSAILGFTAEGVRDVFRLGVRYLGPLRAEPQVVMSTSATARTGDIGPRGEYTAAVLRALGSRQVQNPRADGTIETVTLLEALTYWTQHLGLVDSVRPDDLGAVGLTISVRPSGVEKELPLPSVGVGVSQLLPVLVLCLTADRDDVLLLEQPELHLHPAMQQRLGDFLLAIAASGRQLVIETHSEYLVSRLRRRIVEDETDSVLELVNIIFAERDPEAGSTSYRQIKPSPLGSFDEWPAGFFDQSAMEEMEILRAAEMRRTE